MVKRQTSISKARSHEAFLGRLEAKLESGTIPTCYEYRLYPKRTIRPKRCPFCHSALVDRFIHRVPEKVLTGKLVKAGLLESLRKKAVYFALSPSNSATVCRSTQTFSERILSPSTWTKEAPG